MKRRTRLLLVLPVLLLALPLAALFALTHSEATLQFVVRQLPQRFGSIERLAVTGVQGTLAGGLHIARIEVDHGYINASVDRLRGARIVMGLVTVTGTENLMMAATLADGTTVC